MAGLSAFDGLGYDIVIDGPISLVWNPITQAMHQVLDGAVLGPVLSRVPFSIAGRVADGFVVEAVINTQLKRLLVHPLTKESDLAPLQVTRYFSSVKDELLGKLEELYPAHLSPVLGFHPGGWGGHGSPGFVDRDFWVGVGDKIANAGPWLDMERIGSAGSVEQRWGNLMRALRNTLTMPLGPSQTSSSLVLNAVGEVDSQRLASALLTLAVGQHVFGLEDISHTGAVPANNQVLEVALTRPGWAVGVYGFEATHSRSRLLEGWSSDPLETNHFRSGIVPPTRIMIFSESDIATPNRPGRAGNIWEDLAGGIPVWNLPPAPPMDVANRWVDNLTPTCPAADPKFQKKTCD